jgi:hypothetical protein
MKRQAIVQGMASTYQVLYRFETWAARVVFLVLGFWFLVSGQRKAPGRPKSRSYTPKDYTDKLGAHPILRRRNQKDFGFPDQPPYLARFQQPHRCRWQAESFFKWLRDNLGIKACYGTVDSLLGSAINVNPGIPTMTRHAGFRYKPEQSAGSN